MSQKKEFFTLEDRTGSIFLKFYDEQIIEYWGDASEQAEVAKYAKSILDINEKMKNIKRKIQLLTKRSLKELDDKKREEIDAEIKKGEDALAPLTEERQKANDACAEYCASVVRDKGYYKAFCSHLRSIPCVPNDGTYNASDCYYIMMIKHDKDVLKDDIWSPSPEKAHYHIAARTAPIPGKRVRQITIYNWLENIIKIRYRKGIDDSLMKNQGVDVCRSYNDCCLYLLHATSASINDGKYPYIKEELIHNMNKTFVQQILLGMKRLDGSMEKLTLGDWETLEDDARNWGLAGYRWRDFLTDKSFELRSKFIGNNDKAKTVQLSYNKGMEEHLSLSRPDFVRNALYIQGKAHLGKTKTSRLTLNKMGYNDDDIFDVGKGSAKYDMYNDERCLICEDRGLDDIRRVTESNYCRLRKRNKGESLWYGDLVIVTSNMDFEEFCIFYTLGSRDAKPYKELTPSQKDNVDATKSRFTYFKCNDEGLLDLMQVSDREKGVKRISQARFAFWFHRNYNEIRKKYLDDHPVEVDDEYLSKINFLAEGEYYAPAELDYISEVQSEKDMHDLINPLPAYDFKPCDDGYLHIGFESVRDEDTPFH